MPYVDKLEAFIKCMMIAFINNNLKVGWHYSTATNSIKITVGDAFIVLDMIGDANDVEAIDEVYKKYLSGALMSDAAYWLNEAEMRWEQPMLTQSVEPRHIEPDFEMTRRHWRHIPNHNPKRKLVK